MNGIDAALFMAFAVLMLIAIAVGGFLAARSPTFWLELGRAVAREALPKIGEILLKRNSPEIEARMHECHRRGGTWDNFKKRCK